MTTPWQVIEEALARKRPPRGPKWLADELNESIQTVSNWKVRGVPVRRYREIANALGLTVDQIEGLEPLPWERLAQDSGWPFTVVTREEILALDENQLGMVEGAMLATLERIHSPNPEDVATFNRERSSKKKRSVKRKSA